VAVAFEWGTDIEVRAGDVPFRCYTPRRTHVVQVLEDGARWDGRTFLVQGDRRLSFADVSGAIDRCAAGLADAGLRAGDRLLLLTPNSPEWVVTFWATVKLGAIVVLGNGWWGIEEIAHAVGLVGPRLVVADARRHAVLPAGTACLDVAAVRALVDDPGTASPVVTPAADEDDPAVIVFTAGTTGRPKAVTLAHRSVIANLHNLLAVSRRLPQQLDPERPPAVSLQTGPLFHIGGLQSLLLALLGGNTLVFLTGRFDAGEVLDIVERERVTWWGAIPTMASRVLGHPSLPDRDLSTVRSISMGGMPVQPALLARLSAAFPNARRGMSTIYGMTETGGTVASASGVLMAEHPTTSGAPLPVVDLRIADGEILVRTPGQMLGYWAESADLIDADGWVHTGDLGRLEDGLLYVTGRRKDLVIRGGENVAPAHVEAVLLQHPAVAAAAVLGLPDDDLGERVAAVVVPSAAVTEAELAAYAAGRLARFEVPSDWWLRAEELPSTDAGKIDKRSLRRDWPTGRRSAPAPGGGSPSS
jgi:long-chain acyl-CoA synthetase